MSDSVILHVQDLGAPPWPTEDPFLFCVHHNDAYPAGDERMAPRATLAGRNIGSDFSGKNGWSMYHGDSVPGFPRHPHRGFETVTLARSGFIDHSDSLGATARFGHGDAQWMTAGRGVVHSEMFPLVKRDADNPTELFQIWLNLPAADKMVAPYFTMFWSEGIPRHTFTDDKGRAATVVTVAGALDGAAPPAPPPDSWASKPDSALAIWTVQLEAGARWTMPPAPAGANRTLYFFQGRSLRVGDRKVPSPVRVRVADGVPIPLLAGPEPVEILMLQGRPIGEPVAKYGPFVMNTAQEIQQAFIDYRKTGFGGWPWSRPDPVHLREEGRFAIHADGRKEDPVG